MLLLRKDRRMLPLLPPLEELGRPPPLDGGLPLLSVKLNGDVENKRLPVKELPLLEGEPNRELPLLDGSEFAEDLVEFAEPLEGLENPDSVGLVVGLNELLEGLENPDYVGLGAGLNELLEGLENLDLGAVGLDLVVGVGAVSLPRHL